MDRTDAGDLGLSVLLTQRRHWLAGIREGAIGRLVDLVPTASGDYWHIRLRDGNAGECVFTKRPMTPFGVGLWLEGQDFPLNADWREGDGFQPTDSNPFLKEQS